MAPTAEPHVASTCQLKQQGQAMIFKRRPREWTVKRLVRPAMAKCIGAG
jgi:hypothetical protein